MGDRRRNGAGRRRVFSPALTRELVKAAFPLAVADDQTAMPLLSEAEIAASLDATLAAGEPIGGAVWVFAYGSLVWKPDMPIAERRVALVRGWHRRFCLWQWRYRGTRDVPGIMLALDRGGACKGMLLRVDGPDLRTALTGLWRREMVANGYRPRWVRAMTDAGSVPAITFVVNRDSGRYAGRLSDEATARHIAVACGHTGPSAEYLAEAVLHYEALGIHDPLLWRLQHLVAEHLRRR